MGKVMYFLPVVNEVKKKMLKILPIIWVKYFAYTMTGKYRLIILL